MSTLETGLTGLDEIEITRAYRADGSVAEERVCEALSQRAPDNLLRIAQTLRLGISLDDFDCVRRTLVETAAAQNPRPAENGVQRRAELVRHGRHELVFQLVGRFGIRARPLRLLVQARAIQRLRTMLRNRDQQRLVVVRRRFAQRHEPRGQGRQLCAPTGRSHEVGVGHEHH